MSCPTCGNPSWYPTNAPYGTAASNWATQHPALGIVSAGTYPHLEYARRPGWKRICVDISPTGDQIIVDYISAQNNNAFSYGPLAVGWRPGVTPATPQGVSLAVAGQLLGNPIPPYELWTGDGHYIMVARS